jgi:hypothetical protein
MKYCDSLTPSLIKMERGGFLYGKMAAASEQLVNAKSGATSRRNNGFTPDYNDWTNTHIH